MRTDRAGFLFLMSLFTLAGLLSLAMVGLSRSMGELSASIRYVAVQQAFQLAEFGVDEAIAEFALGGNDGIKKSFSGPPPAPSNGDGWTNASPCTTSNCRTKTGNAAGGQMTSMVDNINATTPTITASGTVNSITQRVEAVVALAAPSIFAGALFGKDEVRVENGAVVDSYNSDNGAYNVVSNRLMNGTVRTNSIADDSLRLENVSVYGKILVGAGGNPSQVVDDRGGNLLTETPAAAASNLLLDPIQVPPGLPNSGNLTGSQVLSSGTYQYSTCSATSGVTITTNGPVTLYCDSLYMEGGQMRGRVGGTDTPAALIINVIGSSQVELRGGSTFVGALYAPNAEIRVRESSVVYGSAVSGSRFRLEENAKIHYDEKLADISAQGVPPLTVRCWRTP